MGVQTFSAEPTIKGFNERIVSRFSRPGEVQGHTAPIRPQVHISRDKLAAIIDPDCFGVAGLTAHALKRGNDILTAVTEPGIQYGNVS